MALKGESKYLIFWVSKERKTVKAKRRGRRGRSQKGMDSIMDFYDFGMAWISCIDTCLWVVGCRL